MLNRILTVARRRWWAVLIAPVLAGLVASTLVTESTTTYDAGATVLVPSGAGPDGPGSANEAARLARQYTELIPADRAIMSVVADDLGVDIDEVRDGFELLVVRDSTLLEITYRSDSPNEATAAIDALLGAIVRPAPAAAPTDPTPSVDDTSSIPAGFLTVVDRDDVESSETDGQSGLVLGAVLAGLAIGIGTAVALERSDVRIDDADSAVGHVGVPSSDLALVSDPALGVVVGHWLETNPPGPVGLFGVTSDQRDTTSFAADRVRRVHALRSDVPLDVRIGDRPGGTESGEWLAAECSVIVLVVPRGAKLDDLADAAATLRNLDMGPSWVLVTDPAPAGVRDVGTDLRPPEQPSTTEGAAASR